MMSSSGTSSKPSSVSMPFRYLMGFPLGAWIMRKAMVPSVEIAGNILTGTRTRDRRSQPCHDKVEQELAKPTKQLDESKPSLKLALAFVAAALMSTPALALKGPARWLRSFWHW